MKRSAANSEFGIRSAESRNSAFTNSTYSAFRIPHSGISLTEVLISMGLLALGLLGVAAMFPVGSYYLLKGDISDRGSAAAQAAFSDLVNRGMLQPEAWIMGNGTTGWNETLTERCKRDWPTATGMANPLLRQQFQQSAWGSVYVIDPLGVAAFRTMMPNPVQAPVVSQHPIVNSFRFDCTTQNSASWYPWYHSSPALRKYPVRRMTLPTIDPTTSNRVPLPGLLAEQLFYNQDDLAIELPEQNDRPGQTRWEQTGTTRSYDGLYSWIATIAPTSYAATVGLWTGNPGVSLYDVSVAVFHRRPLSEIAAERHVRGAVISSTTSGGQLLLTRFTGGNDTTTATPYEHLKVGQYVTVYGPHPQGSNEQPYLFFQWYRVVSIDGQQKPINNQGIPSTDPTDVDRNRIVTLRGPDWPWKPTGGNLSDWAQLPNDLRVGIYNGAVAVHTKTMRLAGGANSGSPWATAGTVPPRTNDPPYVPY